MLPCEGQAHGLCTICHICYICHRQTYVACQRKTARKHMRRRKGIPAEVYVHSWHSKIHEWPGLPGHIRYSSGGYEHTRYMCGCDRTYVAVPTNVGPYYELVKWAQCNRHYGKPDCNND